MNGNNQYRQRGFSLVDCMVAFFIFTSFFTLFFQLMGEKGRLLQSSENHLVAQSLLVQEMEKLKIRNFSSNLSLQSWEEKLAWKSYPSYKGMVRFKRYSPHLLFVYMEVQWNIDSERREKEWASTVLRIP